MARLDARYKHRGVTFRRSHDDPSWWEIMNQDGTVLRTASKGALCRQIIDALLDGHEPPHDAGKRSKGGALFVTTSVHGSTGSIQLRPGTATSRWIAQSHDVAHNIPKEEIDRVVAIVQERSFSAEAAMHASGKKIMFIDLSDLPVDVLRAIGE